jgi:hypothetical protein
MELALSGSLFSVSGFVAYRYDNYITAYTSFIVSLTSIFYHLHHTPLSYWMDQIALYSVILRSFVDGYEKGTTGITISLVVCSYNYIIFFSPYSKFCCFHSDPSIGNQWHRTIHLASVLGIILQQVC